MSPTQLTLRHLRKEGWLAAVVERWVPFPKPGHRADLWGFVDLLAIRGDENYYIQACAGNSHAARVAKVKANSNLPTVLGSANPSRQVWVYSWSKTGPRGKRKLWKLRTERIYPQ